MRFTKMHGIGNDYIYVDCFTERVNEPEALARRVSDRHVGIGGDGLILICPSKDPDADVQMRMFNADGSEAEMCGNGIRCLAKYAYEHGRAPGRDLSKEVCAELLRAAVPDADQLRQIAVHTGRGILQLGIAIRDQQVEQVCVDMGEPILLPADIPVKVVGQQAVCVPISVDGQDLFMTCVSMGNPHAVFFCDDVDAVDLAHLGPLLENHESFPQRVNAHFVQRLSASEVRMRTWERGSAITLACGTGAAAVCVAAVLASKTDRTLLAHLPGGDLQLHWNEQDNHVYMAGPATEGFTGDWPED